MSRPTRISHWTMSAHLGQYVPQTNQAQVALLTLAETTPLARNISFDTPRFQYSDGQRTLVGAYHISLELPQGEERWCVHRQEVDDDSPLETARKGHAVYDGARYRSFRFSELTANRIELKNRRTIRSKLGVGCDVDTRALERRLMKCLTRDWATLGHLASVLAVPLPQLELAVFRRYLANHVELDLAKHLISPTWPVRKGAGHA